MPQLFNNNEFDKQFRDAFDGARSVPSSKVWKRIEKELDKKPIYLQKGFWISCIAVVSVSVFLTLFYLNNENTLNKKSLSSIPSKIQLNEKQASSTNLNSSVLPVVPKQNLASVRLQPQNNVAPNKFVNVSIIPNDLNNMVALTSTTSASISHLSKIKNENRLIPFSPMQIATISKIENHFVPLRGKVDVTQPVNLKGFYAGAFGSYVNSWLYDKEAWRGNANLAYQYTQGYSFGFSGGYNFSNHFGVGSDVIIESKEGQKYFYRPNAGRLIHALPVVYKSFVLNYFQIPLYAEFKMARRSHFTKQATAISFLAGAQFEHLKTAYASEADVVSKSDMLFNKNGIDGLLGLDYEIHTAGKTFFTVGARGSFGLNTIFNADSPSVPYEQFQQPHNMVFSARAAVNFSLAGK